MSNASTDVLLSARDISVTFGKGKRAFHAVKNVSFDIYRGETFGVVGESGSGKTTIGRAIMRIQPLSSGEICYNGQRISGSIPHELDNEMTRKIQMIFQDPMASLNERAKVEYIVAEGLYNISRHVSREYVQEAVSRTLSDVGLLPEFASRFPHEFSGGQRQRIGLARALILDPKLIVCDEPVSALDVSIQSQIINLLCDLREQRGLSYLFIAHDMSVIKYISDRVGVMYLGHLVEEGQKDELFAHPQHPYTQTLMSAVPSTDPRAEKQRIVLQGDVPSPIDPPSGCVFHTRCPYATKECSCQTPQLREIAPGHRAACIKI